MCIRDRGTGQLLSQFYAAGSVPLHNAHPHMVFQQFLTEVVGNGTAAHDEGDVYKRQRLPRGMLADTRGWAGSTNCPLS